VFKNSKILVTGGAGFIAANLISRLLEERPQAIRATYHHTAPLMNHCEPVDYVQCDLMQADDCKRVSEDMDYVFMCAAASSGAAVMEKDPLSHVTPNVLMNTLMLQASYAARVKKFIFLSSTVVYPLKNGPISEDDIKSGDLFDKYFCVASMKMFSETLCEMYASKIKKPMKTVVIRVGNAYGIHDDFNFETSHVIPALIRRVIERQNPISVWGDGNDLKDFLYIEDAVNGILLATQHIDSFNPVHIATGESHTIREVLNLLVEIDDFKNAEFDFDLSKPTMIPKRIFDISKAKQLLNFESQVSLREGLSRTVKWYRENLL